MEQNLNDIFNDFNFTQPQFNIPLNTNNTNNTNNTTPTNPSMRFVNRQLDTIYETLIRYNDNMVNYQRNMTQIINLISLNNSTFSQRLFEIRHDRNTQQRRTQQFTNRNIPNTTWFNHFQNVPFQTNNQTQTFLTVQEIETVTRTFNYNNNNNETTEIRCPISLDNFQEGDVLCKISGCGHVFKKDNLLNWLRRNSQCPICRFNLRTAVNRTRNRTRNNRNRSPRTNTRGVMRNASGNIIDGSNNPYSQMINSELSNEISNEISNMVETLINLNPPNYDISFNVQTLFPTNVDVSNNNNNDNNDENDDSDDDDDDDNDNDNDNDDDDNDNNSDVSEILDNVSVD